MAREEARAFFALAATPPPPAFFFAAACSFNPRLSALANATLGQNVKMILARAGCHKAAEVDGCSHSTLESQGDWLARFSAYMACTYYLPLSDISEGEISLLIATPTDQPHRSVIPKRGPEQNGGGARRAKSSR